MSIFDALSIYHNNVSTNKRSKIMDFMSFLLGGIVGADIMEEYYRDEIEEELYQDYLYELEQEREALRDFYALNYGDDDE